MTPLERAARALHQIDLKFLDRRFEELPPKLRRTFFMEAEAVLRAVRLPDAAMIEAGSRGGDWPHAEETWQAMIDAALGEER